MSYLMDRNRTKSSEFTYERLIGPDDIRLIILHPALDPSDVVQCSLVHNSLSVFDNRDIFSCYTALSYVWGCHKKTKTIWIDGAPLKITENLFSALHDLRDKERTLHLWADGICINQGDNTEKAMQIRMMRQIYARASNTVIYLGPTDIESVESRCLAAIRKCYHRVTVDIDTFIGLYP